MYYVYSYAEHASYDYGESPGRIYHSHHNYHFCGKIGILSIGVVDIIANSVDTTLIRVNMIQHCW